MFCRPWSEEKVGPLVSPWLLFGKNSRVVSIFGQIMSSAGVPAVSQDSIPFLAEEVFSSLVYLAEESDEPVKIVINSPGGDVHAGMMIIEAMEHLQAKGIEVWTVALGAAGSMASVILAAGTEGKRFALARSNVHLHSGEAFAGGKPEDKEAMDQHLKKMYRELMLIFARRTKIPEYCLETEGLQPKNPAELETDDGRVKWVEHLLRKETPLFPEEALKAGVIDHILASGDPRFWEIFRANATRGG